MEFDVCDDSDDTSTSDRLPPPSEQSPPLVAILPRLPSPLPDNDDDDDVVDDDDDEPLPWSWSKSDGPVVVLVMGMDDDMSTCMYARVYAYVYIS